jgi:hypothetical protein
MKYNSGKHIKHEMAPVDAPRKPDLVNAAQKCAPVGESKLVQ